MAFETILMVLFAGLIAFSFLLYFFSQNMQRFFKSTKDRTGEVQQFLQAFLGDARGMKEKSFDKVSKSMAEKRLAGALASGGGEKTVMVATVSGSGRLVKKG